MRINNIVFLVAGFAAVGLFCGAAAAEDKKEDAKEAPAEARPSLSPEAEGAGLYLSAADGNLGNEIWQDTQRPIITRLIEAMPVTSRDPAMQKLIFGILLSKTDVGMIKDGAPPPPGRDLLTLRLEKLIAAGAYRQALDLYSSLELEDPPESVAREGVTAMLFSGEKSLACVELNTVKDEFTESDFFKTVAAYCDATLSEKPSEESLAVLKAAPEKILWNIATQKDFTIPYNPESFEKLLPLEKAAIVAEGKLTFPANPGGDYKNIPAAHLQIVMKNPALTEKEKFILNLRALEFGLMHENDYKKALLSGIDLDIRKDPALAVPAGAEDWQALPYFMQIATNKKEDADKWANIRQAFPIGRTYGLAALTPFAELLNKVKPDNVTFSEMVTATLIMNRGGFKLPAQWIDIIDNYKPAETEKAAYSALLATAYISDPDKQRKARLEPLLAGQNTPGSFLVNNIIENVDKDTGASHTALEIYENAIDLTFQHDYVMPSMSVWNRLPVASKEGHIGETILLVTAALRGTALKDAHPGLFRDTLDSLKSVGLTDISGNMAIAAVLGNQDY